MILLSSITTGQVRTAAEVVLVRVVPGLVNVGVLILLAQWLTPAEFGLSSTYIATSLAAANLIFGPLMQSALVLHSEHGAAGRQDWFERKHLANIISLSLVTLALAPLAFAASLEWRMVALISGFGLYSCALQLSQARMQFIRFGIASMTQSLVLVVLAFAMVRPGGSIEEVLELYSVSYVAGTIVSLILRRARPSLPSFPLFKASVRAGVSAALSNATSDIFTLGSRYLLVWTGQLQLLAIFSFSVDLAQRTVGFCINIATFAVVPHALNATKGAPVNELWTRLARGWSLSLVAALGSTVAILLVGTTSLIGAFDRPVYDAISFAIVALGVTAHRSAKMVVTPVAIRLRRTRPLVLPYLLISPVALVLVYLGLTLNAPYAVEIGYFLAFAAWGLAVYLLVIPAMRRADCAGPA